MAPRNESTLYEAPTHIEKAHDDDEDALWVTDFEPEKAREFADKLLKLSRKEPKRPIIVYIDSNGGRVDSLSAMISAMDAVKNPIITVAMGNAMSCGADLLSYGDIRYASPNANIMIHEVSAGAFGNIQDMKVTTAEVARLNEHWMGWLAKNCGKTLKQLQKCFTNRKRDIYMTPEEAVKFGLVDKVGIPRLKKTVKFEIED